MVKAVILARGLGTRMRERGGAPVTAEQAAVADRGLKAMIPVGRPFLDYLLGALADAGYERVCLVIGPEHRVVREHYAGRCSRLSVDFAIQPEPRGTADAVAAAREFAGDDPFLVINGDNYYPPAAMAALRRIEGCGVALFDRRGLLAGNIPAERIARFAVAEVREGLLRRIVEKPDPALVEALGQPVCVSMNCWRFDASIFEACARIQPSPRGELEITDAVDYAIQRLGRPFRAIVRDEPVLDLSSRADIAAVAERLAGIEVRL